MVGQVGAQHPALLSSGPGNLLFLAGQVAAVLDVDLGTVTYLIGEGAGTEAMALQVDGVKARTPQQVGQGDGALDRGPCFGADWGGGPIGHS